MIQLSSCKGERVVSIRQQKKALRRRILERRTSLDPAYREAANRAIAAALQDLSLYRQAQIIMYYVDFRGEVATRGLIRQALDAGKSVCVPLTRPVTREMVVCRITDLSDLAPGNYGVLEPILDQCEVLDPKSLDMVIVPGVAFDDRCHRLGYGGGYYDRFARLLRSSCPRIALAYECQIVNSVPVDRYDWPVDAVITEKRIIYRRGFCAVSSACKSSSKHGQSKHCQG